MTATEPTTFTDALVAATAEHVEANEGGAAEQTTPDATDAPTTTTESPKFTVKVDGQDVEVTQDELLNGYQRQADYTRKTQELASERQRLAQAEQLAIALDQDPADAIARLTEMFGVDPQQAKVDEDLDELDPLERDVLEIKRTVAQQQEVEFQREIEAEVDRIRDAYGDPSVDINVLLQHAVEREIGSLDAAYRDMKFAELYSTQQSQEEARRAAEDTAAQEAARAAAVVEGGSNRAGGTVPLGGDRPQTVADAWAAAEQEFMA